MSHITQSAAGTLTFMVGGSEEALERARVYLNAMGKNIVHCGEEISEYSSKDN